MHARVLLVVVMILWVGETSFAQSRSRSKFRYEEVAFEDMVRRYFGKDVSTSNTVEGIYSVSCIITKRYKPFFSNREKMKVVGRRDNYARVAVLKDWPGANRDFIEISLSYRDAGRYPVVGEIDMISEGGGMIYRHLEPDRSVITFSMASEAPELLEGEYSTMEGKSTITYKLSYLKVYPKSSELIVDKY